MMKTIVKKFSFVLLAGSAIILAGCGAQEEEAANIAFAQCLTEKGFKMYGANWCGHCQQQKEMFGLTAFESVDYVECTKQQTMCELAGVRAYPTWIGEGYKQSGVRTFEELAQASGCEYMQDTQTGDIQTVENTDNTTGSAQ